ncbi:MAG: hypothetical protein Q9191_004312 [Dirinaria sp. TL-2023a]
MADTKDASAQTRIMKHMNADHQDSLIRYLRHHHHISFFSARNAELVAMDLSYLTIVSASHPFSVKEHRIPIDPPLASWAECSPITVKKWIRPYGTSAVNFTLFLWLYSTFCRRANFLPGSLYYRYFFGFMPGLANFCSNIQPFLFYGVLAIHLMECLFIMKPRLQKHTVRMFNSVWWLWSFSSCFEGVGATLRFDRLVKEEEEKKAKQKH